MTWGVDEARKHAFQKKPGQTVDRPVTARTRLNAVKVDHFIDILSSPSFLQDVASWPKTLKLWYLVERSWKLCMTRPKDWTWKIPCRFWVYGAFFFDKRGPLSTSTEACTQKLVWHCIPNRGHSLGSEGPEAKAFKSIPQVRQRWLLALRILATVPPKPWRTSRLHDFTVRLWRAPGGQIAAVS